MSMKSVMHRSLLASSITVVGLWAACAAPAHVDRDARPTLDPGTLITLRAHWEPCRESKYGLFASNEVLRTPRPVDEERSYGAECFTAFLPKAAVQVGDAWTVDRAAVLPFLRQFHPGARAELHHGFGAYQGAHACLVAQNEQYFEILVRAHAEFLLEAGITYTPAQFEGRLVGERQTGRLAAFQLALPDRNTNVDVNVPATITRSPDGPPIEGVMADIGWVPRMELAGGRFPDAAWTQSMPIEEARRLLASRFYPFTRIGWRSFAEAVQRAHSLDRPLHVVVLFGTLDDESC
jgi:selenoprotein N